MEVVCFILIIIMFPFTAVYADYQVDALFAFKKALDDPTGVLSNWIRNSSIPCSWDYIHCDLTNNAVITVDLGDKSLAGPLVGDLGNLNTLQYIDIGDNELAGSYIGPRAWKLRQLRVNRNKINGSIPAELGNLTNLLSLNLGNNSLNGSIPKELGNLKNLTWLLLNDNNLSGEVPFPDPLTNLFPNIKLWNFSGNPGLCGNLTDPYKACTTT